MVALLLRLNEQGITALPLHDGIMVPSSKANMARRNMEEVFVEKYGVEAMVSITESESLSVYCD